MRLEKSKNSKRNIAFGLRNKIITLVLPFVIRTIIIKTLGSEYLGLNSLFSSILQVLNLSELGFSSAVVYSMYRPIAEEDHEAICALMKFYRKVYRIIGFGILTVGIILLPFIPHLITGTVPDDINVYVLYIFYLTNTVLSYLLFAYKVSLLNAYQRQDVVSNTLTITQGGMYICQIAVLLLTKNYYIYAALMIVFTILNNIINAVKVKKLFPEYKCVGKIKERELTSIKRQVPGLLITKLCYISRNSFDSIFISAFLGLRISAMYGNYYYIMNALVSILMIISTSILAGVGNSQVTDTPENNYNTMNKINFIYMWISGWCTICLLCLYQPFMKVWVGKELSFDFGVVILLCVYFYITEMGVIRGVYSDAAGLWWENRYRAMIESIANLVLNYVLVQLIGIYGIILATVLSLFFINFCWGSQIVFDKYFKNRKQMEYFLFHLKYASVTFLVAVVTFGICMLIPLDGMLAVITRGVVCCIIPNVIYILIYHRTSIYQEAIPWILERTKLTHRLGFLLPRQRTDR